MRWLPWLLVLLAQAAHAADASFGSHGMVLFGGKAGLFASHLPMLHPPHDTQAVIRIRFADPQLDAAIRRRLDGRTALWTIDPERFELSRLGPQSPAPLTSFQADVVQGHFEQGGKTRYPQAQIIVEQVVLYRPLASGYAQAGQATYVPVGAFLVKLVDSRPDFDHIVLLRAPAPEPVRIGKPGLAPNLRELAIRVQVAGTVYYAKDDLQ